MRVDRTGLCEIKHGRGASFPPRVGIVGVCLCQTDPYELPGPSVVIHTQFIADPQDMRCRGALIPHVIVHARKDRLDPFERLIRNHLPIPPSTTNPAAPQHSIIQTKGRLCIEQRPLWPA